MGTEVDRFILNTVYGTYFQTGIQNQADPTFRFSLACAATTYVNAAVNPSYYMFMSTYPGSSFATPTNAEDALAKGYGLCGNHAWVMEALFGHLSIPMRTVQFFWNSPTLGMHVNHILKEVDLTGSGGWAVMDSVFGFLAKRRGVANSLLSTAEIRSGVPYDALQNTMSLQWLYRPSLEHFLLPNVDILLNDTGVIHPYVISDTAAQTVYSLLNSMTILGHLTSSGNITYALDVPAGKTVMRINPTSSSGAGQLLINGVANPLPTAPGTDYAVTAGPLTLAIQSSGSPPCYIGMDQIVFRP